MNRIAVLSAMTAAVLAVSSGCGHKPEDEVKFTAFDEAALQAARGLSKPTLVFATAEWCGPCQRLHAGALSDADVKAALEPFARLEIDGTERNNPKTEEKLAQFRISAYPTLVFFDRAGNETDRFEGPQTAETIIEAAKQASK